MESFRRVKFMQRLNFKVECEIIFHARLRFEINAAFCAFIVIHANLRRQFRLRFSHNRHKFSKSASICLKKSRVKSWRGVLYGNFIFQHKIVTNGYDKANRAHRVYLTHYSVVFYQSMCQTTLSSWQKVSTILRWKKVLEHGLIFCWKVIHFDHGTENPSMNRNLRQSSVCVDRQRQKEH